MSLIQPQPLASGDEVRVIAPSCSIAILSEETKVIANERFADFGYSLTFGENVGLIDDASSSPIDARVQDLHAAFADPNVTAIFTVLGGYNANQLLPFIDWDLIRANPKIFCGYSDITALSCSMLAKSNLVTFSGPHYSSFGMVKHFDQTITWFRHAMAGAGTLAVSPPTTWTDDEWFLDQIHRETRTNDGYWVINPGTAEGHLLGGNLCTMNLLQGTEFMPSLDGTIVFVEDDMESLPHTFDRDLTSLTQLPAFDQVQALLIGRFQTASEMSRDRLTSIVRANPKLASLPVIANMDFGHTNPMVTMPVGGQARVEAASDANVHFEIDYRFR